MNIFVCLFLAVLLYILWVPTINRGLKRLRCTRQFDRTVVYEGEEGKMIEIIRNDSPYMIPWLRLESYISPHLQLGKQANLDVGERMYYCSLFSPMPYQQIKRTHRVKYLHRGVYDLGSASLTAADPLSLVLSHRDQKESVSVMVYPRLLEDEELPQLLSRLLGDLSVQRQLLTDPFLFRGIRNYQPGDPVRSIHWPATARTGQAQVRVFDYTARTRLLVVLNVQHMNLQWHDRLPDQFLPAMEHGIRLAATMCVRSLRSGLPAGFATNMPSDDPNQPTVILPACSSEQEDRLMANFSRLDTTCVQRFPVFLESLAGNTGLDILVLSLYDSDAIQQRLERLRQAGNQVTFYLMEGGQP